jgi:hypothetical protein
MYFFPFNNKKIHFGFIANELHSRTVLRLVSPTIETVHYRYLWKMHGNTNTFGAYTTSTDYIYVLGHCDPGGLSLTNEMPLQDFDSCDYDDLADIFVGHGLPANSAAKIRIHACNSGSPATFGATQLKSFAERLKTDLVSKGRNNVTVRGYTCAMGIYLLGYRHGSFPFVPADVYAVDF